MKKILVVFSGRHFAYDVLDQAAAVAVEDNSLLVGLFLRPPAPSETVYPFINDLALTDTSLYSPAAAAAEEEAIKTKISFFKDSCNAKAIRHLVHNEGGTTVNDLINETAFADLIIISANTDLYGNVSSLLTPSLREFLADSHCPVLVVHEKARPIEHAVLTYDGSVSSMHAIKMFSYLFPHMRNAQIYLVTVNEGLTEGLMHDTSVTNWLDMHFTHLVKNVLTGEIKDTLANYLINKQDNTVIVMGAYGRSAVSRLFRQSLANYIISKTNAPLFITHE
jgi:nucleotide-binding universal stress UspA family protein